MTAAARQRARKQPAEVRRETVLDAAIKVFARRSYHAAGTAEIAREAGISEPTIYRYFDSKRELYLAALERSGAVVRDTFAAIAARAPDAARALSAMGDWYAQMVIADPEYLRLRQRAIAETDDAEVQTLLRSFYLEIHALVSEVIRRGREQGTLARAGTPEGQAWLFLAVGQILDLTRLIGLSPEDCYRVCDEVVAVTRAGMVTPPA